MVLPIGGYEALATEVNHFYPDLANTFVELFEIHKNTSVPKQINSLFRTITVDGAYTSAQTWGQPAMPGPALRGQYVRDSGFDEFTITYYVHDYITDRFVWHVNDRQDSRAPQDLKDRIQQGAIRLGMYKEHIIDELLTATIGSFLHPDTSFTNIFGGSGMFDSNHSYAGQTLDNSYGGSGTDTSAVIDDLYGVKKTFRQMVDSIGRPYWDRLRMKDARYLIMIPPALEQVFDEVMKAEFILKNGALSSSSNVVKTVFGDKVEVMVFELLTDADNWYVFLTSQESEGQRPFVFGERKGIEQKNWLFETSDWAKENHQEALQWWMRFLVGIGVPFCGIEVTN